VSLSTVAGRKMSPAKAADITRKLWEIGHMPTSLDAWSVLIADPLPVRRALL